MATPGTHRNHWKRQRRHSRISLSEPVQYYVDGKLHRDRLIDVGEGGLRLEGADPLPLMSKIRLFVSFRTGRGGRSRMCVFDCQVVWRGFNGVGVQFVDPPIDSLAELRALMRSGPSVDRPRDLGTEFPTPDDVLDAG
jgi:hypothetical protein